MSHPRHSRIFRKPDARAAVSLCRALLLVCVFFCLPACKSSPPSSETPAQGPQSAQETPDVAEQRVAALFQGDPDSYKVFQSVQADYRSAQFDEAVKKLQALLEKSPDAPWAEVVHFQLAQALRMKGDNANALRQLDRFLDLHPSSPDAPDAMLAKGEIHLMTGKERKGAGPVNPMSKFYLDKALRIFQEVQARYPGNRSAEAQALYFTGIGDVELGDNALAEAAFRKVVDQYSDTSLPAKALYSLAGVYLSDGNLEAAERAFGEITDRYPESRVAEKARAQLEGIGLVGYSATPLAIKEWIGEPPPEGKDLKGKATLLNFWAIWCPHCRQNIPKISELADQYASQGLNVVGVTREQKNFETDKIREFIRTHPMHFATGIDDAGKTSGAYSVSGVPRIVLVDAQGKIRWHGHPDFLTDKVIRSVLESPPGS
jgi:outer membrane protein assembly factor BamD (BamD/ComL family)/peroxiredoxin